MYTSIKFGYAEVGFLYISILSKHQECCCTHLFIFNISHQTGLFMHELVLFEDFKGQGNYDYKKIINTLKTFLQIHYR